MSDKLKKTINIFNADTKNRTILLDNKIKTNTYYRGYLFRNKVCKIVSKGSKILDYGCGSGRIAWLIAQEGYTVNGVDPANKLIEEAKLLNKTKLDLTFSILNDKGESLPPNFYDAIVCSSAIEFIPNPKEVLLNFKKTLKPKGKLIISFPNKNSFWRIYAKLRFGRKYEHFSVQWHLWSSREFKQLLTQTGFIPNNAIYFESAFNKFKYLRWLNRLPFIGTLCCIEAIKDNDEIK